jgi:hypothetical protein
MLISGILIGITTSVYTLFRRSMLNDQAKTELSQNARIAVDRLSRELRQTPAVVTVLPLNAADTSVAQPQQIEYENGHEPDLTYRRYYLDGSLLKQDIKEYYFSDDPTTRVHWNSQPAAGVSLLSSTISTTTVAENVQSFVVYGAEQWVEITLVTSDEGTQSFKLRSYIYRRNI